VGSCGDEQIEVGLDHFTRSAYPGVLNAVAGAPGVTAIELADPKLLKKDTQNHRGAKRLLKTEGTAPHAAFGSLGALFGVFFILTGTSECANLTGF